mgnify:CR=1 FL=1
MIEMKGLIGCSFKRNKYGKSKWTDEIKGVYIVWSAKCIHPELIKADHYIPIIMIEGSNHTYELSDIIITKL